MFCGMKRFNLTDIPHRSGAQEQWLVERAPLLDRPLARLADVPGEQVARWEWLVARGMFGTPHGA